MPKPNTADGQIQVLMVDDDEDDYLLTLDLFGSIAGAPFGLEWVATYPAALEAIRRREYAVYLIDYRLGELTGIDLLREAHDLGCDAPMIILTGWANPDVDRDALEAGAADFLDKSNLNSDRLERSLRYSLDRAESLRKLEQEIASKDQFVASVSHELRTPLTAVLGFAELLREELATGVPAETLEMVDLVARQAQYAANIVSDLLVTAAPTKVVVNPAPLDLRRLVEEAVADLGLAGVAVNGPELAAYADTDRVMQIIRNLLTNAVRYGGNHIDIGLNVDGDLAAIEVSDDGAGVHDGEDGNIFDAYHSEGTTGAQPGAMGLGLTVSRTLARLMGGDLEYERSSGRTVFRLTLPGSAEAADSDRSE